jgi:hypothetical protein
VLFVRATVNHECHTAEPISKQQARPNSSVVPGKCGLAPRETGTFFREGAEMARVSLALR